ncbi:unnamed protein product [Moneuplotes crassus]|uniref:Uncharacterized protein n=1 Tax=Euplotes crassus TaxID=5936 RepID=A0AAD1X4S8_EUPCR|nr:unnamed protein product [Moneuplotes crassus]
MDLPICKRRSCKDRSKFYILSRKLYVCHKHKADDSINLTPPDSIISLLKVIDQCRKELLISPKTLGYLGSEEEYSGFDTTITEAIDQIFSSLRDIASSKQFFKLEALLQEAKQLEDLVMNDQLFIKYSATKNWKEALGVIEGTVEKSAVLATKELREEYARVFKRTADKLKEQRNRILEEKSRPDIKLSYEKTKIKNLKKELENQEISLKQDMKRQKEEYEEKIEDLINIQSQLEQAKSELINASEQKDQQISELMEDIKCKSDDLEDSYDRIKRLEQKVKAKTEKKRELRERIKNLKANFAEEKEALEENHECELRQHRRYHDILIEESHEKNEKDLQEQLASFNNKCKEQVEVICNLEQAISNLSRDLHQERTEHQALMATFTNFQEEKQSIVLRHAEDAHMLKHDYSDLEEKSMAQKMEIMKLNREIEDLKKRLEHAINRASVNNHSESSEPFEQEVEHIYGAYSYLEATNLCNAYTIYDYWGGEMEFSLDTKLNLFLNNSTHLGFLTEIGKRLPDCESISIRPITKESYVIKTFLSLYFPLKVGEFNFNGSSNLIPFLHFYINELCSLSSKIEERFVIRNFEVSQSHLHTLLAAYKHTKYFCLDSCNLSLNSIFSFEGSLQGSTLQVLDLSSCGSSQLGNWEKYPSRFKNLIKALAQEKDFKRNLKQIRVEDCGMERSKVEEVLKECQFGEVEIFTGCL